MTDVEIAYNATVNRFLQLCFGAEKARVESKEHKAYSDGVRMLRREGKKKKTAQR